jgi:hypothetical protein
MHYHAQIHVPTLDHYEDQIAKILAPHLETHDSETEETVGFWDWYQIGGRYSGRATGYDPETDPRNIEECSICNGTGFRNDERGQRIRADNPSYTCNGCGTFDGTTKLWAQSELGTGKCLKWPTKWASGPFNICSVEAVPDELTCFTLIANGIVLHHDCTVTLDDREIHFIGNVRRALDDLGIKSGYLITVDYHC